MNATSLLTNTAADKIEKLNERLFIDPINLSADMIVDKFVKGYHSSSNIRLGSKLNFIRYLNWKRRSTGSVKKLFSSIAARKSKRGSEFKYPHHSLQEVQTIVEGLSSCLRRFQGVEVLSAGPKSVLLKKG